MDWLRIYLTSFRRENTDAKHLHPGGMASCSPWSSPTGDTTGKNAWASRILKGCQTCGSDQQISIPAYQLELIYKLRWDIAILNPQFLIGVGAYAEQRLRLAAPDFTGTIAKILNPSPASPASNRDWAGTAQRQLIEAGVWERES
jgi:hypothetical protein